MAIAVDLRDYLTEDTIFITPTGSRLYGLENEQSDYDFTILSAGERHSFVHYQDGIDIRQVDFLTYARGLRDKPGGVFLESLYSQKKILGAQAANYLPYLNGFTPKATALQANMLKMAIAAVRKKPYKRVRFAIVLASRWNQWRWSGQGRYDPTLTPEERQPIEDLATGLFELDPDERERILRDELFTLDEQGARELYHFRTP